MPHYRSTVGVVAEARKADERAETFLGDRASRINTRRSHCPALFAANTTSSRTDALLVILGFRAGLRWQEAVHLRIDDFLFAGPCAELQIRDNEGARTKTLAGRRVVPLHCLLEQHELDEVRAWWLHRRIEILTQKGGQHRRRDRPLFPKGDKEHYRRIKRDVEHEVKRFTGNKDAVFHDLRHSFGSYLIATLALSFDVLDDALILPIDPSVVSHERRERIAATLLGRGRQGLNALHATGALLGHSGERTTLVSYFHLHDWLAANYVSRPEAMRAVPAQLAARLLATSDQAVLKASSRARHDPGAERVIRRARGRPAGGSHALGSAVLTHLVEKGDREISRPRVVEIRPPLLPGNGEPGWEVLVCFISASTKHDRDLVRQHPTLMTAYGKRLVAELDAIFAMPTNGRNGRSSHRFTDVALAERKRAVRRLTHDERDVLAKLYNGFRRVDPHIMDVVSESFLHGYDRARGYITVPQTSCSSIIDALNTAGLTDSEISVEQRARTALIRFGALGRMHRGYTWGLIFSCAAHRASKSIICV
jgi:integrase